jgi:hypothetical protein
MTQAITTKVLHATKTKGTRIKASCERGSVTISYPYELSHDDVHIKAATDLVRKFLNEDCARHGGNPYTNPWAKPFVTGSTKAGYVHVFTDKTETECDFIVRVDLLNLLD